MRDDSAEILFQSFLQGPIVSSSGIDRDSRSLTLSIYHFLVRLRCRGALEDGLGQSVVACDMPEPCEFSSLDCCQKSFPWAHKEVDFALHPVVGFVRQVRDAERLLQTLGLESLDSFSSVGEQVPFSRQ